METILYGSLAVFALLMGLTIFLRFKRLRREDQQRAQDLITMRSADGQRSIPLGMEATGSSPISQERPWYLTAITSLLVDRPHLDHAIDRQHQLSQRLNPQGTIVHATATDSAKRLVTGIARINPVVVFMNGKADTTQDANTQLLVDLLTSLQIDFKDVDVPADPEMYLGLPQKDGTVDLPYLYVGGLALGGPAQVLDMAQSGYLITQLDHHDISYDSTIATGLVKTD